MAFERLRPRDLRRAIEQDAISLHYLPQVHVPSGTLAGVEAFLRWPHLSLGLVGPADIAALVEGEEDLQAELDRHVVRTACAQQVAWVQGGVVVPLCAVSLWPATLRRPAAVSSLLGAIAAAGARPAALEIKCPRGAATDPTLSRPLVELRGRGVRLATDQLPADGPLAYDTLKVPYAAVRGLEGGAGTAAVREAVAAGARTGARVVAEGVETAAQQDALLSLGCEIVQGYLYGPEMGPAEIATRVRREG